MNDDELLLYRLKNNDNSAFEDIFNKYSGYLLLQANFFLKGDVQRAKDAVQQLFLEAWRTRTLHKMTDGREEGKVYLKQYLKKSIIYICIRQLKEDLAEKEFVRKLKSEFDEIDGSNESEIDEYLSDSTTRVNNLLEKLPPNVQLAFKLVYLEELPREQVVGIMNISRKTLRNHLSRGISILRKMEGKEEGKIVDSIDKLPPNLKRAWQLVYIDKMPLHEAQEVMKISISTIRKRLADGRKLLRCESPANLSF